MKAHRILTPIVALATSLTAFSQGNPHDTSSVLAEDIPDIIVFEGTMYGDNPYAKAVISDIDSIKIDAANNRIYISDKYSGLSPYGSRYEMQWHLVAGDTEPWKYRTFENAYFTYRPSEKLPSPNLAPTYVMPEGNGNSIMARWTEIAGSDGYELRYRAYNSDETTTISIPAGQTQLQIDNLEYSTQYFIAVRALFPGDKWHDPEYVATLHSDWSSRTDLRPLDFAFATSSRYEVPEVIYAGPVTSHGIKLHLNLKCTDDKYRKHFQIDGNDNFIVTSITVTADDGSEVPEEFRHHVLSAEELAQGSIVINGLKPNTAYTVTAYNDNVPAKVDAPYNSIGFRTVVSPDEPYVIEDSDLNRALAYYLESPASVWPEGQTFYLRGDMTYNVTQSMVLSKGFTLETRPEDVAAGKIAKIDMNGISFMLSASGATDIAIVEKISFKNIEFDSRNAINYGAAQISGESATGNYFINCYSTGGPVEIKEFEISNCTFHNFIRGFVRLQGNQQIAIDKFSIDGCLFYDCGYYDNNGRGYAWFAGNGTGVSNMYNDFSFTNNTIYDSPRTAFINDNDKNIEYADNNIKWNIRIENNTFINFSTRSSGRNFFQTRFVPGGSHFTFKRNLIVLTATDSDNRPLNQGGVDIRGVKGDGTFTFDIADNYSVGCRENHNNDDGIFNSAAFSAQRNSFGSPDLIGGLVSGNPEDLVVKALKQGETVVRDTDLFTAPQPVNTGYDSEKPSGTDHQAPADMLNALKYKFNPAIIIEKNVGDPRWRK
ncbi:MAG: fibronectin type III domain-containing protein [Bacteroides sp.]|nr:fibronectin type III domain-containing protein [Bacteroides sp.]